MKLGDSSNESQALLPYQYRPPFSLKACAAFPALKKGAAAAVSVAIVSWLGTELCTARPEFRLRKQPGLSKSKRNDGIKRDTA